MRIVKRTRCCGAPIIERPFQCMHEFHAWQQRVEQLVLW